MATTRDASDLLLIALQRYSSIFGALLCPQCAAAFLFASTATVSFIQRVAVTLCTVTTSERQQAEAHSSAVVPSVAVDRNVPAILPAAPSLSPRMALPAAVDTIWIDRKEEADKDVLGQDGDGDG